MQLHIDITRQAAEGLRQFATHHGITLTALIEVTGLRIDQVRHHPDFDQCIAHAREIDAERRQRSQQKKKKPRPKS